MNKPEITNSYPNTLAVESTSDPGIEDNEERGIAIGCKWRNTEKKKMWIYTGFDVALGGPRWIEIPWDEDGELTKKVGADCCVISKDGESPFAIVKIDGHVVAHLALFRYDEPEGKVLMEKLVGNVVAHHFSS